MSDLNENKNTESKRSIVASLLDYVEVVVFSIAFVIILFTFFVRLATVSGSSMDNTLKNGEQLIVSNIFYEPEAGDIIVFHQTGGILNEPIVKRVIAVGGETIDIDFETWTVTVTDKNGNTRTVDEPYMYLDPNRYPATSVHDYPLEVPEGKLFVMGDNRNVSNDSRYSEIGLVDERRVLGKAIFRITPFDKFGPID